MKVLIHPGFHKTGTTTFQRSLAANRALLQGRLRFLLPEDLRDLGHAIKRWSANPAIDNSPRIRALWRAHLQPFADRPDIPLLLSSEALCGQIPGRKGIWAYDRALEVLPVLVEDIPSILPDAEITVLFGTREPESWMKSVFWQNLRSNRIVEDYAAFRETLLSGAQLDQAAGRMKARLDRRAQVLCVNISSPRMIWGRWVWHWTASGSGGAA